MDRSTIRFISSDYKELFRIPDGGSIRIIYPPGDDRGTLVRKCSAIDEMHVKVGVNTYHICEFAERMEAIGARYEPEHQLQSAEITPFTPGEEKFYTYNRDDGNTCVGHVSGDFGQNGDRFHSGWYNHGSKAEQDWNNISSEFQIELHSAVYALRQDFLKDYNSMRLYCETHPEAMIESGDNYRVHGFKLETDSRQYFIKCFIGEAMRDARFMIYAYDNAGSVHEQDCQGKNESPSILDSLDAKKAEAAAHQGAPAAKKQQEEIS